MAHGSEPQQGDTLDGHWGFFFALAVILIVLAALVAVNGTQWGILLVGLVVMFFGLRWVDAETEALNAHDDHNSH